MVFKSEFKLVKLYHHRQDTVTEMLSNNVFICNCQDVQTACSDVTSAKVMDATKKAEVMHQYKSYGFNRHNATSRTEVEESVQKLWIQKICHF